MEHPQASTFTAAFKFNHCSLGNSQSANFNTRNSTPTAAPLRLISAKHPATLGFV